MCTSNVWNDLNGDIRLPGHLDKTCELIIHDRRRADDPVDDGFIHHGVQSQFAAIPGFAQEVLPAEPRRHLLIDEFGGQDGDRWFREGGIVERAGVTDRLEQAGNDGRVEILDRNRLRFEPDVSRVRQVEGLPPALFLGLPGERHEPVALGLVRYAVDLAETPDVAERDRALGRLHTADFAR